MARVQLTIDHIKTGKYVLNVESVGLTQDQFFRLCGDNPELRLQLTAQKEIIVTSPTNSKTGVRKTRWPRGRFRFKYRLRPPEWSEPFA